VERQSEREVLRGTEREVSRNKKKQKKKRHTGSQEREEDERSLGGCRCGSERKALVFRVGGNWKAKKVQDGKKRRKKRRRKQKREPTD